MSSSSGLPSGDFIAKLFFFLVSIGPQIGLVHDYRNCEGEFFYPQIINISLLGISFLLCIANTFREGISKVYKAAYMLTLVAVSYDTGTILNKTFPGGDICQKQNGEILAIVRTIGFFIIIMIETYYEPKGQQKSSSSYRQLRFQ